MQQREIGILWDLDGTLVDTRQAHFDTWHAALLTVGVDLPRRTFDQNFGRNNAESLPNYLGYTPDAALAARLSDLKEALFIEQAAETAPLFDCVINWLDYFKSQAYHQAIASSAPMQNIDVVVDARGIRPYFQALCSGSKLPSKPAPDLFLEAADALGVAPRDCIVIEDAPAGLAAGRNAGMKTIALASSHPADKLVADLVLADYASDPQKAVRALLGM